MARAAEGAAAPTLISRTLKGIDGHSPPTVTTRSDSSCLRGR